MLYIVLPSRQQVIRWLFFVYLLSCGHLLLGQKPVVRLLHLNDVYEISPLENGQAGGLARVATVRKTLLESGSPVLTFLVGDFVSPSVIGTLRVDGERVQGRHMVEVMNELGVDWVILGNHEFDIPMAALQKRIDESRFRWMSTNVKEVTAQGTRPFQQRGIPFTEAWTYKVDSLQIGFFAVTLPSNQKPWVSYEEAASAIRRVLPTLRSTCQVIVGLTHLNVADDRKLVKEFPEVSLWLGGHDHEHMKETIGQAILAKADANAKTVWVHDLVPTDGQPARWRSTLVEINSQIPEDSATQHLVLSWEKRAEASLQEAGINAKEVVFTTKEPLDGRESRVRQFPTRLTDLILGAMFKEFPTADVCLLNGGSIRIDDQLIGPVTQWDVVRILPFGGSVVQVQMRGNLLQQIVEMGKLNQGNGGFLHNNQSPEWIQSIDPRKSYAVVMPSFLLTGQETNMKFLVENHPDILTIQKPKVGQLSEDIRKMLIAFLKASGSSTR